MHPLVVLGLVNPLAGYGDEGVFHLVVGDGALEVGEVSFDAEELDFSLICSFQIIAWFPYPIFVVLL